MGAMRWSAVATVSIYFAHNSLGHKRVHAHQHIMGNASSGTFAVSSRAEPESDDDDGRRILTMMVYI